MRRLLAGGRPLLVFAIALSMAASPSQFRSGTIGVRVDVLVTNGRQLVRDLHAGDFELKDDGVVQTVDIVEVEHIPLNVILAVDTSSSVAGDRMRALLDAGAALVDGLRPPDRAALLSFSTRVHLLAPLTPSRPQIRAALVQLQASGSTSLRDAAFAGLALREADPGRTLMLVFSDGRDTSSWLTAASVIESAKRSDIVVYAVALPRRRVSLSTTFARGGGIAMIQPGTTDVNEAGKFLDHLAAETGGRVLFASSDADLRPSFTKALDEFRDRYVLSYTPRGVPASGWHPLEVRVKGKPGNVTARRGYFAQ